MGEKGSKMNPESVELAQLLDSKLSGIENITHKKMFGGFGFFCNDKMFGIVDSKGKAFLKADDALKKELIDKGGEQHSRMPYYSIPEKVLGDEVELKNLAQKSINLTK